jgi:hypothetical protein
MKLRLAHPLLLFLFIHATSPSAGATEDEPLSPAVRSAVLDAVVSRLESTYVDVDAIPKIVRVLRTRKAEGAYESLTNPAQFGEKVTQDMRSVNGDLHLGLRYSKEPTLPPSRGVGVFGDPRLLNFGMGRAEILEGNIGYLEITAFTGGDYQEAVVDALRFLSRTDAVILDVRRNGGGASDMSHFIFSHFFGPSPIPTIDVRTRASSEPQHRMSLADVPGPRRPEVPLFLLISQATGSAAEEFGFVLKNRKRATLVGRRTAGAGHMVAQIPVGNGFTVSVSITRVSDPLTGAEWEQVGVQPDLATAPEDALTTAHAAALKAVMRTIDAPARQATLRRLIEADEARLHAGPASASQLARLAGVYEGREVSTRDGQLFYARRVGGLPEPLVPIGGDVYALAAARLTFAESSGRMLLTVEQADGSRVTFTRDAQTR